jgi:hypothetical protein
LATFEKFLIDVRNALSGSRIEQYLPAYRGQVYKESSLLEQSINAEMMYSTCSLVNSLMLDFLYAFVEHNNNRFMAELLNYNSSLVVEIVFNFYKVYAGLYLDDFAA